MLIIVTVHTMCDQQRLYKSLLYIISKNLPTSIDNPLKKCYILYIISQSKSWRYFYYDGKT